MNKAMDVTLERFGMMVARFGFVIGILIFVGGVFEAAISVEGNVVRLVTNGLSTSVIVVGLSTVMLLLSSLVTREKRPDWAPEIDARFKSRARKFSTATVVLGLAYVPLRIIEGASVYTAMGSTGASPDLRLCLLIGTLATPLLMLVLGLGIRCLIAVSDKPRVTGGESVGGA